MEDDNGKIKESIQIVRTELLKHGDLYDGFISSILSGLKPTGKIYEDDAVYFTYAENEYDLAEKILGRLLGEEK